MYNGALAHTAPVLAATGLATAHTALGAWTLALAGVTALYTARVLRRRATAGSAAPAAGGVDLA